MGPAHYIAHGITFDGTENLARTGSTLGGTDGKTFTGSFWIRLNALGGTPVVFYQYTNIFTNYVNIQFTSSNYLQIVAVNTSTVLNVTTTTAISDTNWHHIAFSFDMANAASRHIMIDGVASGLTVTTYADATIDFTHTANYVGSANALNRINGDFADFWLETGVYMDLTNAGVMAKFRDSYGRPADLGTSGQKPNSGAPDIFLSGTLASPWYTNKGTGTGFSVAGAGAPLTTATSSPSQASAGYTSSDMQSLSSGLIAHWTLDENPTTTPQDSIGSYDCVVEDGAATSVTGRKGNGMEFAGDSYNCGDIDPLVNGLSQLTYGGWIKQTSSGNRIHAGTNYNDSAQITFGIWDDNMAYCTLTGSSGGYEETTYALSQPTSWHHLLCVYDGSQGTNANRMKMYVDGVAVADTDNGTYPSTIPTQVNNWRIGPYYGSDANGSLDDIRIYNRTLSAAEISALYAGNGCTSPEQIEGSIIYNTDHNVMQYCNGAAWIPMGPIIGSGGSACTSPAGAIGTMIYNTTNTVLQYCNGSSWIRIGN